MQSLRNSRHIQSAINAIISSNFSDEIIGVTNRLGHDGVIEKHIVFEDGGSIVIRHHPSYEEVR